MKHSGIPLEYRKDFFGIKQTISQLDRISYDIAKSQFTFIYTYVGIHIRTKIIGIIPHIWRWLFYNAVRDIYFEHEKRN